MLASASFFIPGKPVDGVRNPGMRFFVDFANRGSARTVRRAFHFLTFL